MAALRECFKEQAKLPQVREAACASCSGQGAPNCRGEYAQQYADDADRDKQFNKCEGAAGARGVAELRRLPVCGRDALLQNTGPRTNFASACVLYVVMLHRSHLFFSASHASATPSSMRPRCSPHW